MKTTFKLNFETREFGLLRFQLKARIFRFLFELRIAHGKDDGLWLDRSAWKDLEALHGRNRDRGDKTIFLRHQRPNATHSTSNH